MTIALGMIASDGIVLAADTQETEGYFKGFSLKINTGMTHTDINAKVKSAIGITGAGPSIHLDAISDEIINRFHSHQHPEINSFQSDLADCVREFYLRHVAPLPRHTDRDFRLIAGVQIENTFALWTTDATVLKQVNAMEAVGTGSPLEKWH